MKNNGKKNNNSKKYGAMTKKSEKRGKEEIKNIMISVRRSSSHVTILGKRERCNIS